MQSYNKMLKVLQLTDNTDKNTWQEDKDRNIYFILQGEGSGQTATDIVIFGLQYLYCSIE